MAYRILNALVFLWLATTSATVLAQPGQVPAVGDVATAAPSLGTPAQTKLALLIGNWDYDQDGKYTDPKQTPPGRLADLSNPCNDIELIQSKLLYLKWPPENIVYVCNGTKADILSRIQDFTQRYMESDQPFGFIYYAGHGVQVEKDSYIFGVDTSVDVNLVLSMYKKHGPRASLFRGGIKITREVLSTIGDPGRGSLLVVMDACRENPLYSTLAKQGLVVSGPKQTALAARGIKIFYSTADGELAPDGVQNSNSDFAYVFASQMVSNPSVDHVLRTVADEMYEKTKFDAQPQIPDEAGTLNRPPPEVCFTECK